MIRASYDMQGRGYWDVYDDRAPREPLGNVVRTPYGFFANPHGSQIQSIPCDDFTDAMQTVIRLTDRAID